VEFHQAKVVKIYLDVPIFNTVEKAVAETGANVSIIFVPAPFAADAIIESAASGIDLIVCITERIPVQDMIKVKAYLKNTKHDSSVLTALV